MMSTPTGILPPALSELRERLAPFCERHGVVRLEVFGSAARGEVRPGSDIDLLVTFRPGVHLGWDFFELEKEAPQSPGVGRTHTCIRLTNPWCQGCRRAAAHREGVN